MSDEKKYYVGVEEVINIEYPKEGWVRYTVRLTDMKGKLEEISDLVTVEQFEAIKSETPYESGQVLVRQWNMVIAELLATLLQHDIKMGDREFIIRRLEDSLLENYRKASAKLFKRKHGDFVRMSDIHAVLKADTEMSQD